MSTERDDNTIIRMSDVILPELERFQPGRPRSAGRSADVDRNAAPAIERVLRAAQSAQLSLSRAPFVAYVKADIGGHEEVRLICRQTTPDHQPITGCEFVSYFAPMGRLAALPVGQPARIRVPAYSVGVTVLERNTFVSVTGSQCDAINNVFTTTVSGVRSIKSLREFLVFVMSGASRHVSKPPESLPGTSAGPQASEQELSKALEQARTGRDALEQQTAAQIRASEGVMRAFELRDRALLDTAQDEIFRLPLNSRLVLTGAPGTGKTTVLIKRVAQKTYKEGLTEEERSLALPSQIATLFDRENSWVLFTPNDLLRNYLKEALGKEHLPATEKTVVTWTDQRQHLSRDVFKILKAGNNGHFRKCKLVLLNLPDAKAEKDYVAQFRGFWTENLDATIAQCWTSAQSSIQATHGAEEPGTLERGRSLVSYRQFLEVAREVATALSSLRRSADTRPIDLAAHADIVREPLRRLKRHLERFSEEATVEASLKTPHLLVRLSATESVEAARARLQKSLLSQGLPPGEDPLTRIADEGLRGRIALARQWNSSAKALDRLSEGYEALVNDTLAAYRQFRIALRERTERSRVGLLSAEGKKKENDGLISETELDLLLVVLLRLTSGLFARADDLLWSETASPLVKKVRQELRAIVTVDEAPDFSWAQLECMYRLAHPLYQSFAMSGDLMQRVTSRGIRSWDECTDFMKQHEYRELRLVYRNGPALMRVAKALYEHSMKATAPFDSPLPELEEPQPLLVTASSQPKAAQWVAERIVEIYEICQLLPSIGVFVPVEADVASFAQMLGDALSDHAIDVEACSLGKVLGTGDRVRVFALEHIKGLEFQGVFLVDFDQLTALDSHLADKYLYVGLTRAVQFLGMAVRKGLPHGLKPIAPLFSRGNWASFGRTGEAISAEALPTPNA